MQRRGSEGTGGDNGEALRGNARNLLTDDFDMRMFLQDRRDRGGETVTVDCQTRAGRQRMIFRHPQDEGAKSPHLLLQQSTCGIQGIGFQGIAAYEFGQKTRLVGRRRPDGPHLEEAHGKAGTGQLPGCFRSCQSPANDVELGAPRSRAGRNLQMQGIFSIYFFSLTPQRGSEDCARYAIFDRDLFSNGLAPVTFRN